MCRYVETVRIYKHAAPLAAYHNARIARTWRVLGWAGHPPTITHAVGNAPDNEGVLKMRFIYSELGMEDIQYVPYQMRHLASLKLMDGGDIDYSLKSTDRRELEALRLQRGAADEVLIVKHGFITDTSYTNVAFYDGRNWYTPDTPLLEGTRRQHLLDNGKIRTASIRADQLRQFAKIALFNAMFDLGELEIPIAAIKP